MCHRYHRGHCALSIIPGICVCATNLITGTSRFNDTMSIFSFLMHFYFSSSSSRLQLPNREECHKIFRGFHHRGRKKRFGNFHFPQIDFVSSNLSDILMPPFALELLTSWLPTYHFFCQGPDRKSTRLNSSHWNKSRLPPSA